MMDNTTNNSLHTEDDYSIISRNQQVPSFPYNNPFDRDSNVLSGEDVEFGNRSPVDGNSMRESENLYSSHYALGTAYDHMKRKLSEAERQNKILNTRLKSYTNNSFSMDRSTSSQSIPTLHENEVTKAWEAYSDKCKECEKLRDDLREVEQRFLKSQNEARNQSYKEDLMRAQTKHDEIRKKLQQAELEIRDEKGKRAMAREELQKEKEYHEMVLNEVKNRHHEMESTIANLQKTLQEKDQQVQGLVKDMENVKIQANEMLEKQKNNFHDQILDMEGKLIREKEERTRLEAHVVELDRWKREMEGFHSSTGLPIGVPVPLQNAWDEKPDSDNGSSCSDIDIVELVSELHSLTAELTILKEKTSAQSSVLSRLCEDPKLHETLLSLNSNHFTETGDVDSIPIQCTETQPPFSNSESVQPSIDLRQIVSNSPGSSDFSARNSRENSSLVIPVVSREIHTNEIHPASGRDSPQRIEIPAFSNQLANAFNNIKQAKSGSLLQPVQHLDVSEQQTSYYSTVTDPILNASSQPESRPALGSLSSDSGTGSSNVDTMVDPENGDNRERQASVFESTGDQLPLRYPPSNPSFGAPSTSTRPGMRPKWPGSNPAPPVDNVTVWWPPGAHETSNSPPMSSFVVLPNQESLPPTDHPNTNRPQVREFEATCPIFREPPFPASNALPPGHLSNRPISRARPVGATLSPSPQRLADEVTSSDTENDEDIRVFMTDVNPVERTCPVCDMVFEPGCDESHMLRHINGHFSEDEQTEDQ